MRRSAIVADLRSIIRTRPPPSRGLGPVLACPGVSRKSARRLCRRAVALLPPEHEEQEREREREREKPSRAISRSGSRSCRIWLETLYRSHEPRRILNEAIKSAFQHGDISITRIRARRRGLPESESAFDIRRRGNQRLQVAARSELAESKFANKLGALVHDCGAVGPLL